MKLIKQYWLILTIFMIVSLLVLASTFTHKSFRYDAVKCAEPSALGSNHLTEDQLIALPGKKMVIALGIDTTVSKELQDITTKMDPELILDKKNYITLKTNFDFLIFIMLLFTICY